MKDHEVNTLRQIAELRYQHQLQKVQGLLTEEARLRQDFARIAKSAKEGIDLSMRAMGADHSWDIWLASKQEDINTRLAQVLAQKMEVMEGVRLAFGQQHVLADLSRKIEQDRRRRRVNAQRESACARSVSDILPNDIDDQNV